MEDSSAAPPTASMASRPGRVVSNDVVTGGCHRIALEVQGEWPAARAGQFAMLSTDDVRFPILPRPFSLLGSRRRQDGRDEVEFMLMPVGVGSGLLCSLKPDDTLQLVGPLGHAMDRDLPDGPIVCVAGGYGLAPFLFLLDQWRRENHPRLGDVTVIFGARTAARLSLADRLAAAADGRVVLCTDDGSEGFSGRVDAALTDSIARQRPGIVLTCGPEAMMEAVGSVCAAAGIPARASLETVMGCGYAVCNGCAVAVDSSAHAEGYTYELACREGTVFDEGRLQWNLL